MPAPAKQTVMNDYIDQLITNPTVVKLLIVLIGIVAILVVVRIVRRILANTIQSVDTRYRTRKFAAGAGYAAALLLILMIFSDKLGGVPVAIGLAGAGIAFALQEIIASIAGWIAVSVANFYKTGDRVQLGGIRGDVIDIGILRTTLMECGEWVNGDLYSGRVVRIANSFVFKEPVFNYSGEFPFLWDEITIPIKYGSDQKKARELIRQAAQEIVGEYATEAAEAWDTLVRSYLIENAGVEPMVTLVATDNWMEFTLRYTVNYKRRRTTKDALFTRIVELIDRTGGNIEIASATFQLVDTARVSINDNIEGNSH